MSDYDPRSWHNAYGGNLDSDVHITPEKFIGSAAHSLSESQLSELIQRVKDTKSLLSRAETQGEKDFWQFELDILNRQTPLSSQINVKLS